MGEKGDTPWSLLGIAWEMGYLIALPLIGGALLGRFLDQYLGTSPLFLILGIIVAIVLSTVLVARKTMQVMKSTANEEGEEDSSSSRSGGAQEDHARPSDPTQQ